MNPWPDLYVLIPTYNRSAVLHKAITGIINYLLYGGNIKIVVGDDGSDDTQEMLRQHFPNVKYVAGPKNGHGANMNVLVQQSPDLMMTMDDDHILQKPLHINACVEKLYVDERAGAIRLMGIGGHKYIGELEGSFWKINWGSPELYITSHRPHLKRHRFHDYYGFFPEGLRLGPTEETFCWQCRNKAIEAPDKSLDVFVPLDLPTESGWDHIGDSWQRHGK